MIWSSTANWCIPWGKNVIILWCEDNSTYQPGQHESDHQSANRKIFLQVDNSEVLTTCQYPFDPNFHLLKTFHVEIGFSSLILNNIAVCSVLSNYTEWKFIGKYDLEYRRHSVLTYRKQRTNVFVKMFYFKTNWVARWEWPIFKHRMYSLYTQHERKRVANVSQIVFYCCFLVSHIDANDTYSRGEIAKNSQTNGNLSVIRTAHVIGILRNQCL